MTQNLFFKFFTAAILAYFMISCSKVVTEATELIVTTFAKKEAVIISEKGAQKLAEKSAKKTLLEGLEKSRVTKFAKAARISGKRLFITDKNQFIYHRDFEKWLAVRGNNNRLILKQPKSSSVLRENLRMSMGKHYDKFASKYEYQAHHLVAGAKNNPSSLISQKILKKFQIDINDPMNGILLPKNGESIYFGTWHSGSHTRQYHDLVAQKLRTAKNRQQCMEVLDQIKKDLYQGKIALYHTHKANNLTSAFKK